MHQIASQRTSVSKIFLEGHASETPQKSAPFTVLMGAIVPILPLYTISLGYLYHKILCLPLCTNSSLHNCLYSVSYKHISWPIKASVKWGIINRVSTRNDLAGSCVLQVCEIAKLDSHGSSAFTSIGEHVMSRPLIAIQTCNLTLFSCCL